MKNLLTAEALVETGAGVVVLVLPVPAVSLLLGARLESAAAVVITRVAGVALLSLGVICWGARAQPGASRSVVGGMIVYNFAVAGVLVYAFFGAGLSGLGLWPAVILHLALGVVCVWHVQARR